MPLTCLLDCISCYAHAGRSRQMATVAQAQAHNGHGDVPVGGAGRLRVIRGLSETSRGAPPASDVLGYVLRPFGGIWGGLRGPRRGL